MDFLGNLSDNDEDELVAAFLSDVSETKTVEYDLNSIFGSVFDSNAPGTPLPDSIPPSPIEWQSMQQLDEEACGLTNLPEIIDLPLSSPKRTARSRKRRLDSGETAYSGRLLTPGEAAKVPPITRLEQHQGNPKMIRDHLVEGVTGRWNVNKKQYIWYVRGPNLQGKQVRLGTYLCQKKARRVQQKAVDEYTKVLVCFLSEFLILA